MNIETIETSGPARAFVDRNKSDDTLPGTIAAMSFLGVATRCTPRWRPATGLCCQDNRGIIMKLKIVAGLLLALSVSAGA